jgi:hypothetical protein
MKAPTTRRPLSVVITSTKLHHGEGHGGNRLVVDERAAGHTAAHEAALAKAYDARETGTTTKRQLALLAQHGF